MVRAVNGRGDGLEVAWGGVGGQPAGVCYGPPHSYTSWALSSSSCDLLEWRPQTVNLLFRLILSFFLRSMDCLQFVYY